MAPLNLKSIRLCSLALGVALALAAPAQGDVTFTLGVGDDLVVQGGFVVQDIAGITDHLRVDAVTGNLSRSGALFVHTTGPVSTFVGAGAGNLATTGAANTAVGAGALAANTTGYNNSAFGQAALAANTTGNNNSAFGRAALTNTTNGYNSAFGGDALRSNTTGFSNSAFGFRALYFNSAGYFNDAVGIGALFSNTTGDRNDAFGQSALSANTTGDRNSAFGFTALSANTTGSRNVAVGPQAGAFLVTGSDNIYLANTGVAAESGQIKIGTAGTHTRAFVAGIRGVTTVNANAIAVLIDSAGQLGTVSSSRSVKREIRDMGDATDRLLALRPVMFRYKQEQTLPSGETPPPEYGLIAEEVAEVFPDLVVYDEQGQPFTVKYHEMAPMLLNEMKKQQQVIAELSSRLALLEGKAGSGAASSGGIR